MRTGALDRAIESYSRALAIDPAFPSQIGRGWALAILGRFDDVLREQAPPSPLTDWSALRALALSRVGKYREADRAIETGRRDAEINENPGEQGNMLLISALFAIERGASERALVACASAERMFVAMDSCHSPTRV